MKLRLSFSLLLLLPLLFSIALLPGPAGAVGVAPPTAVPPLEQAPDEAFVVRVYYDNVEDIALLADFDVFEYNNTDEKYVLAAVDRAGLKALEKLGFRAEVDAEETANFALLSVPLAEQAGRIGAASIPGYTCYRTVEEAYAAAAAIAAAHPTLATWSDTGDSWEKATVTSPELSGYDMMVLKLTNSAITGSKPKLFITASIHAREYTPAETAARFAEYLVNNYGMDADVTWLLDYHEIHLMFYANPDGRKKAESGLSWRKNTNQNYCGATSSSRGADLNRNFSFRWGCCGGSSGTACNATYRGPSAGSEPETQAIQNYLNAIFPDQRGTNLTDAAPSDATGVYIDLHSYAQLVLWPWGFQSGAAPNSTALQTLGRKFAYFNSYTPEQSIALYVTDGTTIDFAYGNLGVAAYTIEMGTAFFQDCTSFNNTIYPTNLNALIYAAKVARTPYQTPAGPDALSLAVTPTSVASGDPATLTAILNDTRYRNTNGTEASQAIAAAEYYVDAPPWQAGAVANTMTASDGSFSGTVENVTAAVNTSGLTAGRHTLFVRGKDLNGNWGAFSAVFLTVTGPANQSPTAIAQSVTTSEDTALAITLTGSDVDNDPLTFSVATQPGHGTLSGTAPYLTYTPTANYNGTDSFTFVANDGHSNSAPATVGITVSPVNDAPVANGQSVTTQQDTPVAITLIGSDADGDPLTYSIGTLPAHGGLSGTAPALTYTPASGYLGSDSFTFKVRDGMIDSAEATVSINVTPVNHPPVADDQPVTTAEDTAKAFTLTGSDTDNDPLTFSVATQPGHGTLSGTAPALTYTPAANYYGADSFTFVVNDGRVNSGPATVSITVKPENDPPVANEQSVTTAQNTAVAITLTGSDVDHDGLTYGVVSGPGHGSLVGTAPNLTYTPVSGYSGSDSFTFTASDGALTSSAATVSITVNSAGPVTVFSDNFETAKGWTRNPNGTDTATLGLWERADPATTSSSGTKQMGTTASGSYDLVTGPLAGSSAGDYDVDGGATTIRSPNITLPAGKTLTLSFKYYLAHLNNSSSADYLRVKVVGSTTTTVLQELGAANDDDAAWASFSGSLSTYAGQTVYLLIEAADMSTASLVEAAVDDVLITAQ